MERRRLLCAGVAVEVLLLANICFVQGWGEFNTFSALVVALASIILSCLLLARLAIRKDDQPGLLRDPYFWINAMILLFNLVTFIVLGLHKYIVRYHLEFGHKNLYFAISQAANAVLYTGYTCAFFLCRFQKSK
jgi:hydrogenase-4 membrane subunit HyfE